ncbi:hypothetical protein LTR85_010166 [Meristemomyces frigidus]|nr:hypothetical protein LTR85_010166 [Meristemomyces frigidus]
MQENQQLNANTSQHQQRNNEQYAHVPDDALATPGQASAQSTAGHKRKRSSHNATRPNATPHSGLAAPPRPGGPSQGIDDARPSAGSEAARRAAGPRNDANADTPAQTPAQVANAQPSGIPIGNVTSTPQGLGGSQLPASSGRPINNQASNARATWSQGPNYGRQRLNEKWLPRTVGAPREQAQTSQPALATPNGSDLLTPRQIEALQNANSEPQPADEAQDDEEPGVNDDTVPEPDDDAREDVAMLDGNRDKGVGRWKTPTGPGLEDFGRKMNTLPGTIGSYIHYSNKRLKYNPIAEQLDYIREKLFVLAQPVLLDSQQIADYWPHMTNIWMRSVKHDTDDFGVAQESWECRHRRRVIGKARPSQGQGTRHRLSKRQMLENAEPCTMRIRLTYYTKHADTDDDHNVGYGACKCIPEWLYLKRTEKVRFEQHNHDIDMLDRFRRSDGMMYFVKKKAEEGHAFSSVANWLHDKYDSVTKQAQFMTKQEVANVAQAWRRANKGLKLKMSLEDATPEEIEKSKCMDLLNTTKSEGLMRALALVCERLPEAVAIAMPMLEAVQEKEANTVPELTAIAEGNDVVPPYPGFPRRRHVPTPPPAPRPIPIPQTVESAADLQAQRGGNLRWREVAVGGPSPLPPSQQKQRPPRAPPGMMAVAHTQQASPGPAGPGAGQPTWQPPPSGQLSPRGRLHSTGVHGTPTYHSGPPPQGSHGHAGPLQLQPSYGPPPPPNVWHSGATAYHGGPSPVQVYDAHGRPVHDSAHPQNTPGSQRPPLAPRPPSGSFFPPPGYPAGGPQAKIPRDPSTDEATQRALVQAQTERAFKPPYQAPTVDSSGRQPPVHPSHGHVHGRNGGPYSHTVPFAPMGGDVHGNVNNPGDPDSWRPSWLEPIEKDKDAERKVEGAVDGAPYPVAKLLEDELGAHQGNARRRSYDKTTAVARDRRSESEVRATTLAKELETTTKPLPALRAPQKVEMAPLSAPPPLEDTVEARQLRL